MGEMGHGEARLRAFFFMSSTCERRRQRGGHVHTDGVCFAAINDQGGELVFLGVSNLQLKHPKLMIHDVFSSKDNMVRNACVMLKILTADESSGDGHTLVLRGKTQAGGKSWTVTIEVDKADVANLAHLKRLRSVVDNKDAYLSQPELFRSYVNMELSSELKEAHSKYKKSQKQTTSGHSFTSQVPTKSVSRLGTGKRGALMMAATKDPEVIKAYHQNASAQRSNNTVGAYTAPSNDTGESFRVFR